jgi:arginase family enzyme
MMDIIETNYFEGGRLTSPKFKKYDGFWCDEEEMKNFHVRKLDAAGRKAFEVIEELERMVDPSKRTVLIGGDHRFSHPLLMAYRKMNPKIGLAVFDDHVDNTHKWEISYDSWLFHVPKDVQIRVYNTWQEDMVTYLDEIPKEKPVVASLCLDYLDSTNPLAATTSWVCLDRDEAKPIMFDGFEILKDNKILAFHIAECRNDLKSRGEGAAEELGNLIREFEKAVENEPNQTV